MAEEGGGGEGVGPRVRAMLSLGCADPWPEGSVVLEEVVVTTAAEEQDDLNNNNDNDSCCSSISLDDNLSSLQWLQVTSILGAKVPQRAHSDCPDDVDYKTNACIRPPYTYATLICMAMQASKKSKVTLSCIYKWITDNFCYYRHADPTWQNSIRRNLTLNKCFIKVPRRKDERGKGGFWKIDRQYAEHLLSGACEKNLALQNRFQAQATVPCSATGGQSSLCINPESQQLLQQFEELTGDDQKWDPHLAEGTMLGSWPVARGRSGKRKPSHGSRTGAAKALRRSSSPLLSVDEQKEIGPLKWDFAWDALLDSLLSGELSLEGGEPLVPTMKEEDLTVRGTYISPVEAPAGTGDVHMLAKAQRNNVDLNEKSFFTTAFPETPWPEDKEQCHSDFHCCSTINLDQLFDLCERMDFQVPL